MGDFAKKVANKVIAYAFTAGVVIALILGLVANWVSPTTVPYLTSLLILAGIIVGFFNIAPHETKDYILFTTALVIVVSLGGNNLGELQYLGKYLVTVLNHILAFVLPSVIIVGVKAVINLAKD